MNRRTNYYYYFFTSRTDGTITYWYQTVMMIFEHIDSFGFCPKQMFSSILGRRRNTITTRQWRLLLFRSHILFSGRHARLTTDQYNIGDRHNIIISVMHSIVPGRKTCA